MKYNKRAAFRVDALENRSLLTGIGPLAGPSPAVQADLAKIAADQQKLVSDFQTAQPTLQADQTAIQAAIQNSTSLQAAIKAYNTDSASWKTLISTDIQTVLATSDPSARATAVQKLATDFGDAAMALSTDVQAVQTAYNGDAAIQAAQQKFQADLQPLIADGKTLQADYQQLATDLLGNNPNQPV